MTSKPKCNKSPRSTCRYVLQEKTGEGAYVLAAHGVRTDCADHMATDFEALRGLRPGLGRAMLHVPLAFHPTELASLPDERLVRIGRDYLREMNIDQDNTQWALVRHSNKPHPHVHLVIGRVDLDGEVVSDRFVRYRSHEACRRLEEKYGLVSAERTGQRQAREPEPTPAQARATTPRQQRAAAWSRERHEIARVLSYVAPPAGGFAELGEALRQRGIEQELSYRADGSVAGITFERNGFRVKGSQIARGYGARELQKHFAREQTPAADQSLTQLTAQYGLASITQAYAAAKQRTTPVIDLPLERPGRDSGIGY